MDSGEDTQMPEKYPYTQEDVHGAEHLSDEQKQEIADDWNKNWEESEAEKYLWQRQGAYPSIGDQMDMIYKDMKNGTTTHADAVEAVKTNWPKDGSGPVKKSED